MKITHAKPVEPEWSSEQISFFENSVRPLLVEHCQSCHNSEQAKGELRIDSRGHLLQGGESGPAIEPGNSATSLLMEAVRYESYEMPPGTKLREDQIEILAKWVEMGAPWPGSSTEVLIRHAGSKLTEEDYQWWAFQPLIDPVPPETHLQTWSRNEIDQFILQKMELQQLTPAPQASRRSLLRRLYYDLTGLPPTAKQIRDFEQNPDPDAYEKVVDELLASPAYGERWAQHWLDLVRYAESDGFRLDSYRPQAWQYRDYVIKSLNDDKPYDLFLQEQLAGDELYPDNPEAQIATGYFCHGIYEYNARDVRGQWDNILNEVTDLTGDVFMGLGFQCARCHDHKYDPILQKDYFQLRAFFEQIVPQSHLSAATQAERQAYDEQLAIYNAQTHDLQVKLQTALQPHLDRGQKVAVDRFPDDIKAMIAKSPAERLPLEEQLVQLAWRQVTFEHGNVDNYARGEEKDAILALRRELAQFDHLKPAPLRNALVVQDVGPVAPATMIPKKRTLVEPGFATILSNQPPEIHSPAALPESSGRRSALALWLSDSDNALVSRVIVNRIWQYHFGQGLAANGSDLGRLGGPPSHPELLEWLTSRFIDHDRRFKQIHRLIVNSATYRQSAAHPEMASFQTIDPGNQWYWRGETRRLDAQQIRDSIFFATGKLDQTYGGPSVLTDLPRRSIYTRVMRNIRDPLLEAFDLPQSFQSSPSRNTTVSPIQSLLLINSQSLLQHAADLSREVRPPHTTSGDTAPVIERLWEEVYGRTPDDQEMLRAQTFLNTQAQKISSNQKTISLPDLNTARMPYRDGQAVLFESDPNQGRFAVSSTDELNSGDFTIESFFQARSVYETGSVRTLAGKWSGDLAKPGWGFGITGQKSSRQPQIMVMQISGVDLNGKATSATIFSDLKIELEKSYYTGVTVRLAKADQPGAVHFYLKDLANDDEPLLVAEFPLAVAGGVQNNLPLTLGTRSLNDGRFHGLIDEIRFSRSALSADDLLIHGEHVDGNTLGYWRFEPVPGVFRNSADETLEIQATQSDDKLIDSQAAAFADLCHVLLNSSEFLYLD